MTYCERNCSINTADTSLVRLLKFNKNSIRLKHQFLGCTCDVSSAHSSWEAGGYQTGQGRYGPSPSLQTVPWDTWPLERVIGWSLGASFLGFQRSQNINHSLASLKPSVQKREDSWMWRLRPLICVALTSGPLTRGQVL